MKADNFHINKHGLKYYESIHEEITSQLLSLRFGI